MNDMAKFIIMAGIVLILIGAVVGLVGKIPGAGKLPGDILIKKENFSFYFPLTTCLLLSIVISLIMYFFRR